ncbi:uncharacterized protein PITG_04397 [Phytophthora infestans T30-4]|uniref:No apical meristem-associated C-terminal domain-containing protein n=2 Tax=Phytophthora infestans TaxID=4787 RepID=D0N166_PHYIT|nr:uncharacterized protein PITG_04397 [Phytophthora infestans T30-4]EEY67379.1 conserved hypothetical protein [Phytophthora infestans T30-4]KAF4144411.1 putative NAM-associated domain-containing protein [Phytophthora infestans]|eukprot:XP_002906027.1 conserved hypothetical protein [Phytophthora infestans T30-4]
MPRGKAWSDKEDAALCTAWCATSQNPIAGADQKADNLWTLILQSYRTIVPGSKRSLIALKNRWSDINREVSRLVGCLVVVVGQNESGKTEEDRFEDALKLYEARQGEEFSFAAAYEVLKDKPKWTASVNKKRPADGNAAETRDTKRPQGAKAAIQSLKEGKLLEMQYAASRSIARSMERKNDILSEWASIELFNMPDADPDQRAQFFKILRQKKLSEMIKKIAESKQSDDETSETYQVSAAETEIPMGFNQESSGVASESQEENIVEIADL